MVCRSAIGLANSRSLPVPWSSAGRAVTVSVGNISTIVGISAADQLDGRVSCEFRSLVSGKNAAPSSGAQRPGNISDFPVGLSWSGQAEDAEVTLGIYEETHRETHK